MNDTTTIRRVVAADDPDRRLAQPATLAQPFLRFDPTHELPHVVETASGETIARFRLPGDVALFIGAADRQTLPKSYLEQVALAGDRACSEAKARQPAPRHEDRGAA
jgi:hypothetical protein